MMAGDHGVATVPRWRVEEYAAPMDVVPVRLGTRRIAKQAFQGACDADTTAQSVRALFALAHQPAAATSQAQPGPR